jgi:hypothetical protein
VACWPIDFDRAHRQLNDFFLHCKQKSQQARNARAVKDEKLEPKDINLRLMNEAGRKDEKDAPKVDNIAP